MSISDQMLLGHRFTIERYLGGRLFVLWAPLLVLIAGCNQGPPMASVTGKVTLDGKPLSFGSVIFQHAAGGQPSRGDIQPDGSFVMSTFRPEDGAMIGANRVRVVCYKAQDPKLANSGPRGESLGPSLIPMRYTKAPTSGIVVDVAKDMQPVAIELQSGRK